MLVPFKSIYPFFQTHFFLWQSVAHCFLENKFNLNCTLMSRGWYREEIWNTENKCVFYKRTIKVCVNCSWQCPGTSAPSATHLTVSLLPCSVESNVRGKLRALEWRPVSLKSPSWVQYKYLGGSTDVFPDEGSLKVLIYPPKKSIFFTYGTADILIACDPPQFMSKITNSFV